MTVTAEPEVQRKDGRIVAIVGPVVDVEFPPDELPEINFALEFDIEVEGKAHTVVAEVAKRQRDPPVGFGRRAVVPFRHRAQVRQRRASEDLVVPVRVPVRGGEIHRVRGTPPV